MEEKLYTIEELTGILKLHSKTILRFIHEGKIKAKKIGRTWMVHQTDLKEYVHGELASKTESKNDTNYNSISDRITVSSVIEINEQNSEEASRISNSLMAMLNNKDESYGNSRFDFFYYPDIQKAKYVLFGSPKFLSMVLSIFDTLCQQK